MSKVEAFENTDRNNKLCGSAVWVRSRRPRRGVKDKEISCEQRAESAGETSEISTDAPLTGTSGSGGRRVTLNRRQQRWDGGSASQPSPCFLVDRCTYPLLLSWLHSPTPFPVRLEDGWVRVHKPEGGDKLCWTKIQRVPLLSLSPAPPPPPPPPLCAQLHKHHGDIETDISLLDERGHFSHTGPEGKRGLS